MNKHFTILPNFIIAGTYKAATTSVYRYLSEHPDVCGSSIKEPNFFGKNYSGDQNADAINYSKYFSYSNKKCRVIMESSVGYLTQGKETACKIYAMLPNVKLLFILRDPIDRLYSFYNYKIGLLELPENLRFEDYVKKCMLYAKGEATPTDLGVKEENLEALEHGRYVLYLHEYLKLFKREQIKIMFYEYLKYDSIKFMTELCDFLEINNDYYLKYEFKRQNVSFTCKNKVLHYVALYIYKKLESYLRQHLTFKDKIVPIYKWINQKRESHSKIPQNTEIQLRNYYAQSINELAELISDIQLPSWIACRNTIIRMVND